MKSEPPTSSSFLGTMICHWLPDRYNGQDSEVPIKLHSFELYLNYLMVVNSKIIVKLFLKPLLVAVFER